MFSKMIFTNIALCLACTSSLFGGVLIEGTEKKSSGEESFKKQYVDGANLREETYVKGKLSNITLVSEDIVKNCDVSTRSCTVMNTGAFVTSAMAQSVAKHMKQKTTILNKYGKFAGKRCRYITSTTKMTGKSSVGTTVKLTSCLANINPKFSSSCLKFIKKMKIKDANAAKQCKLGYPIYMKTNTKMKLDKSLAKFMPKAQLKSMTNRTETFKASRIRTVSTSPKMFTEIPNGYKISKANRSFKNKRPRAKSKNSALENVGSSDIEDSLEINMDDMIKGAFGN